MSRVSLLGTLLLQVVASAEPERRAVVIGIDKYRPQSQGAAATAGRAGRGEWTDLEGAVADAKVFESLLITRFGFKRENVHTLYDADATRLNILSAVKTQLLVPAKEGDIVVFYYAGHGSQVRNSKSPEADGLDESIVPADSWRGTPDLRDKELAYGVLNPLVRKGVVLTAIFDSCHSGSIGRGKTVERPRFLPPDPRDAADPDEPPAPEDKGALIFSAAQQDEFAWEAMDDGGNRRGRFTWALQRAILQGAPGESSERLFQRVRALMAYASENAQEPVLAGTKERISAPFLSDSGAAIQRGTVVAFTGASADECRLHGGRDLLLTPGTELVSSDGAAGEKPARVRITRVDGLTSSACELVNGPPAQLSRGRLFRVEKFGSPDIPALNVEIVAVPSTAAALANEYAKVRAAAQKAGFEWVDDPDTSTPAGNVLRFDATARRWRLSAAAGEVIELAEKLPAPALQAALVRVRAAAKDLPDPARHRLRVAGVATGTIEHAAIREAAAALGLELVSGAAAARTHRLVCEGACSLTLRSGEKVKLESLQPEALRAAFAHAHRASSKDLDPSRLRFEMELPVPNELAAALQVGTPAMNGIERKSPGLYRLVARAGAKAGTLEVAWRLASNGPSRSTLPPRTTFVDASKADVAAAQVDNAALGLAQIHGWLSLVAPPGDGLFPWRAELVDTVTKQPASVLAASKGRYKLVLRAPGPVSEASARFVYVFIVDRDGRMSLLYPRKNTTGVENRFPPKGEAPKEVYELPTKLSIGPPFGVDTYVMVTSAEPLGDPMIFDRDPVLARSRGGPDPRASKAGRLFTRIGAGSRGGGVADEAPSTWSVNQLSIESVAADVAKEGKGESP